MRKSSIWNRGCLINHKTQSKTNYNRAREPAKKLHLNQSINQKSQTHMTNQSIKSIKKNSHWHQSQICRRPPKKICRLQYTWFFFAIHLITPKISASDDAWMQQNSHTIVRGENCLNQRWIWKKIRYILRRQMTF